VLNSGTIKAEVAADYSGGMAAIVAGEASLVGGLEVATIVRFYQAQFQSPFGASFSSWSGRPSNEKGWFVSLQYRPSKQSQLVAFNDLFSSLKPRGNNFYPTVGSEFGLKLIQNVAAAEIQSSLRYKIIDEESDAQDFYGRTYRNQYESSRANARIDIRTSLLPRATWVTRAEWVQATEGAGDADHGYLIHQDLSWWVSSKTRLQARVTIFNSESHDSRLYAWEPDVGLASAMPSFQGEGSRHFLMVTYRPSRQLEARIKVARTHMPYVYQMGSGNDLIQDNKRTQINTSLHIRV
jgi:hypothetical protein